MQGINKNPVHLLFNDSNSGLVTRILLFVMHSTLLNVNRNSVRALQEKMDSYVISNESFHFLSSIFTYTDKI